NSPPRRRITGSCVLAAEKLSFCAPWQTAFRRTCSIGLKPVLRFRWTNGLEDRCESWFTSNWGASVSSIEESSDPALSANFWGSTSLDDVTTTPGSGCSLRSPCGWSEIEQP